MQNVAVVGAQWGDEGKGKIVDLLCENFDVVARYQGGHNAGHTVKFGEHHYTLQLIPSGILHPDKLCLLGNGMVIDPAALLAEIARLRDLGVVIGDNLKISDSAHIILPYHRALDVAREEFAGEQKIGTTGRGIGPAYETKVSRYGIRVADLVDADVLREKIEFACAEKNPVLSGVYGKEQFDPKQLFDDYLRYGEILSERITSGTVFLNEQIRAGKSVMFEGAQATMLDIDHGTYPYVTSSNCSVGGVCTGLGVAPKHIHHVIGVVKAYTTRVGGGAFPTELHDAHGEHLRTRGNEYGTVTGRSRRTGWLDLAVLRTASMINGLDAIALTKLDVLDEFDEIPVCTAYKVRGKTWSTFPAFAVAHHDYQPEYRTFKGWKTSTVGITSFDELPQEAKDYVRFIEDETETRASIISTGPRREETILR
ncbi:MAG: adenylosuccinate synthase [Acidobacteria bacterium]|nr:adenylosuccinate synthase [Acidobacteriota bacterium]MBV9475134.1 adenylosuccinate synthase [Acidobacteriota bacterium]